MNYEEIRNALDLEYKIIEARYNNTFELRSTSKVNTYQYNVLTSELDELRGQLKATNNAISILQNLRLKEMKNELDHLEQKTI